MIIARWDPTAFVGRVEVCKGTHLDSMGKRGKVDLLYVEEVLFLLEKGRLCLFMPHSNAVTSIERAWSLLEEAHFSLDSYLVYAALKCSGNVVFRRGEVNYEGSEVVRTLEDITYDVWAPSSKTKFSRKSPSPPSFHVVVLAENSPYSSTSILLRVSHLVTQFNLSIKIASSKAGLVDFVDASQPSKPKLLPPESTLSQISL